MDKLNRDIRRFYYINRFNFKIQGGATREHEVIYKGHKIYYNNSPNINGNVDTIFIDGGRDAGRRPCFHMGIKDNIASLDSIERGSDCFVDRHNNTRDLVELAFQIAKDKGCNKFQLTDNSYISCKSGSFHLSDVYFLTKGMTWYESILPIKIAGLDDSIMTEYRNRVKTMKWKTVSDYLISKGVSLDFIDATGININAVGSSMAILDRIKTMKNNTSCNFFKENTDSIIFISNIRSFHGTLWSYQ